MSASVARLGRFQHTPPLFCPPRARSGSWVLWSAGERRTPLPQPPPPISGVVDAIGVADQRVEQRTHLQELVPVPAGAGQARDLDAEHQAHMAEPHLGHEALEAGSVRAGGAGAAEILVDDDDLLARPAKPGGAVGQTVLRRTCPRRRFSSWAATEAGAVGPAVAELAGDGEEHVAARSSAHFVDAGEAAHGQLARR